jgi:antagonist of KipI
MAGLSIVRPGMLTTVQDLGRWGYQSRGVPVSGALDWFSHRLANRLLGNADTAATLEVTLIGPHLRFDRDGAFAVTGADFQLTLDDTTVETNRMIEASAGAVLRFGERRRGARAWVALAGGIDVPEVLGSRSTHVLTAMGGHQGRALRAGDVLELAAGLTPRAAIGNAVGSGFRNDWSNTPIESVSRLRVIPADEELAGRLTTQQFQVSPRSDRMGYRLEGTTMPIASAGEKISTAVPTGAIQVPPIGQPILLMNDHATTGGYAIAAVVITADLPLAAQLAPGDWVAFEVCSLETADAELRRREAVLGA